jgi:lipoprotein-anchoring transpeptidase ErfK/SrfK
VIILPSIRPRDVGERLSHSRLAPHLPGLRSAHQIAPQSRLRQMSASPVGRRIDSLVGRDPVVRIALASGAALLLLALGMYLYDHSRRDVIADGVRVAGVPVGGLSEAAAVAKVEHELGARVDRPVRVRSGARSWTLAASEAGVRIDVRNMVGQAVSASRGGSIFSRTVRGLFGGRISRDIPIVASYSHASVRALTAAVRAALDRPARDASVSPGATGLSEVPGQDGVRVESDRLGARIVKALTGAAASPLVTVPYYRVHPAVSISQLASRYPAYIVIDRSAFRLRLYQHLKLTHTYEIAVGMEGLETPSGLHHIEWKQVDPPWYVPKKAWAGALAGTVVPPGPLDPLKARFMSFEGGAGIHGIDPSEYETIGHDASHGCVRMRIPDVIALYSRTPVGTPVYIA